MYFRNWRYGLSLTTFVLVLLVSLTMFILFLVHPEQNIQSILLMIITVIIAILCFMMIFFRMPKGVDVHKTEVIIHFPLHKRTIDKKRDLRIYFEGALKVLRIQNGEEDLRLYSFAVNPYVHFNEEVETILNYDWRKETGRRKGE